MGLRGTSDCSYINLRNNCTWSFWGINFQRFPHSVSAAASLMFFSSPSSLWVEFKSLFLLRLHDQIPSTFLGSRFLLNCFYWTISNRDTNFKNSSIQTQFCSASVLSRAVDCHRDSCVFGKILLFTLSSQAIAFFLPSLLLGKEKKMP